MQSLRTPRLDLTPLEPADAAPLFEVLAEPELYRHLPHSPPADVGALHKRFSSLATRRSPDGREQWLNWAVRERSSGEAVGLVEVSVDGEVARLAYFVARPHWRRGIAREACAAVLDHLREDLGVTEAVAEMDTRNTASFALVESLGFMRMALHRDADVIDGRPSHEYEYRIDLSGADEASNAAEAEVREVRTPDGVRATP
jgi:RimJ/RimL family protein N-acetyltransferase